MRLQPIVYTTAMEAATAWWATVLGADPLQASEMWTAFSVEGATLALHGADSLPDGSRVELSLITDTSLDDVVEELAAHGLAPDGDIVEQDFGRQVRYRDPDGNLVAINEHR